MPSFLTLHIEGSFVTLRWRVDYQLDDIPRVQLFKRLRRRLMHIRQTLKTMSIDDIEIKLKYKRDGNLLHGRYVLTGSSLNVSLDQ